MASGDFRVIYLGGMGRSGSTLAERLLGELPGVCVAGEIVHLWQRGVADNERCGCGTEFRACEFWSEVAQAAFGGWSGVDVGRIAQLRASVDRTRFIPKLAGPGLGSATRRDLTEYTSYYARLYRGISQVSGSSVVVDSSKHASLAFCLRRSETVDLRVVHVVRDSRAVAYSWTTKVRRPEAAGASAAGESDAEYMTRYTPVRAAREWNTQNGALQLLARGGVPVLRVRYEDLVAGVKPTLREIARFADVTVDDAGLAFVTDGGPPQWAELSQTHTAAGNPMRFTTGKIAIRPDDRWQTAMPPAQRRAVTALTLPLLRHYGYVRDTARTQGAAERGGGVVGWPSVGVVVPTRERPDLLRAALAAIAGQDYPGEVRIVVVFDQAEPDLTLADGDRVQVLTNDRTPGLSGARNTGILALGTDLVAFCDDDDAWVADKLTAQVEALLAEPDAEFASCGIAVLFAGQAHERLAGRSQVTYSELLRSRMVMVHSSTYLVWRSALAGGAGGVGLVDETIPGSQNEDWDLALRASRRHAIVHVDRPLVRVAWGSTSYYAQQWETKIAGLRWMLEHHPDIAASGPGAARVYAQIAFGYACLGQRRESLRWAARALLRNWHERRLPFAVAVALGLVSGSRVLRVLHSRGHGI